MANKMVDGASRKNHAALALLNPINSAAPQICRPSLCIQE